MLDGWWRADGGLAPEVGARLRAELEAELAARARYDAAQAAAADAAGEGTEPAEPEPTEPEATEPTVAGETTAQAQDVSRPSSAAAQRHDALAALLFGTGPRPAATPMTIVIGDHLDPPVADRYARFSSSREWVFG